ncbi:MAG: zinc-binding dehydrogenase [Candidatus Brocadiae bacterium]|nr:zinc-binding dehydrogenase [Candidatus Brocadiia bacterium]
MPANPTVVFTGSRKVEVEDRPMPEPGPGQLLIRTHCSLISTGTELSALDGEKSCGEVWRKIRKYPKTPGYDNVGTVVDVGEGVERDWVGKRVASCANHGAYVTISLGRCWAISRDIADEDAAFCTLAQIALNGVRRGGLTFGEAAVVYGLGIIGHITAQLCWFAGARPVMGVDLSERRVGLLPAKQGMAGVVAGASDVKEVVESATGGRMADVVFEVTGNPEVLPKELGVLRRQGRCVILASPLAATKSFDFHDLCNSPSFTIIGAHNGSHPACATGDNPWTMARHAEMFFDLVADDQLQVSHLVSHREPVENAPELYEMLIADRSQAMGVILTWPQ